MRCVAVLVLLCPGLALAEEAAGEPVRAAEPVARLASLWAERRDPAKADEALRLATAALAERPDAPERMFWKARFSLWVGDSLTDPKERKRLGRDAWSAGDELARAKPEWVAGHYFAAAGIGLYCSGAGVLSIIGEGLDSKFNERLERALALDPRFEHQGPRLAKGRYFFEMPWPKRNLAKSAVWYQQVLDDDPRNLRAMAWLAETLWREGNVPAALTQLEHVREGHIEGDLPEEERVKAIALQVTRDMEASRAQ
jgi:hypothetical protein